MDTSKPNNRPAVVFDPPTSNQYRYPSGFSPLKMDIFYQQRKGVRLCMSNCREIEVPILYPLFLPHSYSQPASSISGSVSEIEFEMDEMQDQDPADISPTTTRMTTKNSSHDPPHPQSPTSTFKFLALPLELRLKIYSYLLPSRHHKIVTQIPHNGSYYTSSTIPSFTTQSFYPFSTTPSPTITQSQNINTNTKERLTTYKILTSNSHLNHPHPSIYPSFLAVNHQIYTEALPFLYSYSLFDFDTHLSAAIAFFSDRSAIARQSVRKIKVAREIPKWIGRGAYGRQRRDEGWVGFCKWVREELRGLRGVELGIWGESSKMPLVERASVEGEEDVDEEVKRRKEEQERNFREWEFIGDLLRVEGLNEARIAWWGFAREGEEGEEFDDWVRGRMGGDQVVRERIVREGNVVEGVVILKGAGA